MKRLVSQTAALVALTAVLGSSGCMNSSRQSLQSRYSEAADPCVPERYSYQARQATLAPFANQVNNGQILDQFLQNGDFEEGKEVLTRGGQVKLDSLARKRPANGHIYLQTARDLRYDPAKPGEYATMASELNAKRSEATVAYLNATTAGRGINYDVAIIDPAEQRMPAAGPALRRRWLPASIPEWHQRHHRQRPNRRRRRSLDRQYPHRRRRSASGRWCEWPGRGGCGGPPGRRHRLGPQRPLTASCPKILAGGAILHGIAPPVCILCPRLHADDRERLGRLTPRRTLREPPCAN